MTEIEQVSSVAALDRFDWAILAALLADARTSLSDLAPKVGLSPTACARRLKSLEDAGVINGYRAVPDPQRLGLGVTVLVRVRLDSQREDAFEAFEKAVRRCASVVRCYFMSGTDDYELVVLCRDIGDFEHIHKTQLARLPHVARIQSGFALRTVVDTGLPRGLTTAAG